jgi:UDP-N-acetylmuramyl pentapeptide phosphotransferase/UDP-N-acetylglucosamine-1-phosphate transferase
VYSFGISLLVSLCISLLIVRWAQGNGQAFLLDHDLDGVQKMHDTPVPRVGGVAIFLAALVGAGLIWLRDAWNGAAILWLIACSLPAFLGGVIEDVTKRVRPRWRMACMAVSCFLAFWLLSLAIPRTEIVALDSILVAWRPVALGLTLFALLTITNAVNLIDGFNGLAGVVTTLIFGALGWVAYQVGDSLVLSASLMLAGSIVGFLYWNYPHGRIFLGDGGAYFLGFMVGALAISLVQRNPVVSAWFPVLLLAYPLVEVAFSIYRRKILRGTAPGQPDAAHLHQLIFKRVVGRASGKRADDAPALRNALTSPYLWALSLLAIGPAALCYDRTPILIGLFCVFCVSYVWLYRRIATLRVPRWLLKLRRR